MTIGACGQTWWTATEAAAPFGRTLSPLTLATCLELARFLELTSCLEMSPVSVAPVVARLEKMRIPNFILPSVITSLRQVRPFGADTPRTPAPMLAETTTAARPPRSGRDDQIGEK